MKGPPIVHLDQLTESYDRVREPHYRAKHFPLASLLGMTKLGFNLTELAPGSRSFPYHFHHANEELFLILSGEGTLRWPGGMARIATGDLIGCVTGAEGAHQIMNTGSVPLRYLALSTTNDPEAVEYPDSGKVGVIAGRAVGRPVQEARLAHFGLKKDVVDYWAGEE
jgi:uncharacterized cupin superfamily protein